LHRVQIPRAIFGRREKVERESRERFDIRYTTRRRRKHILPIRVLRRLRRRLGKWEQINRAEQQCERAADECRGDRTRTMPARKVEDLVGAVDGDGGDGVKKTL